MKKIELLAPAGSYESLIASANAGCDAAYIGGTLFGARAFADNLEEDSMCRAIDYMHIREKKLYLTVNTLLKDEEIKEQLYSYLNKYYIQGIDAVIVQDIGVMSFIHREFPKLPIHASTQMTLTMAEGTKILETLGVTRVVAGRELSLSEIRYMRDHTTLEIESFVHGALCYSYSGQCLMSSIIGGRSGNRGKCAQPCRLLYGYNNGEAETKYLLSPKDMCTLTMIPDLIDAGINSFKIEGRMKRYEYVAGVTSAYRKQIDLYQELGKEEYIAYHRKNKEELRNEILILKDLYNRGDFHTGYYHDHNGKIMMSLERQNHSGVFVGKVIKVSKIKATIQLYEDVNPQDILEIRLKGKAVYEFTLKSGEAAGKIIVTNFKPGLDIQIGSEVFRTKNNQLLKNISKKYYETEEKLPITGEFYAKPDQPILLKLTRKHENKTVQIYVEGVNAQIAKKQPMTEEKIKSQLNKTNKTVFEFKELNIILDGEIFVTISSLNDLRREGLKKLEEELTKVYRRRSEREEIEERKETVIIEKKEQASFEKMKQGTWELKRNLYNFSVSVINRNQLSAVLTCIEVKDIYLDITDISFDEIKQCIHSIIEAKKGCFLLLPHIFRKETYQKFLNHKIILENDGITGYIIRNFEEYYFLIHDLKVQQTKKVIRMDYMMYVMNEEAKLFWKNKGIDRMTAPLELNEQELGKLGLSGMELIIYGRIPFMISAQCVRKNTSKDNNLCKFMVDPVYLIDRLNKRLPVMTHCNYCYNTIYNSEILSLAECSSSIYTLNPESLRLSFTTETKEEITRIIKRMAEAISNGTAVPQLISNDTMVSQLMKGIASLKDGNGYTKGHFRRGVI